MRKNSNILFVIRALLSTNFLISALILVFAAMGLRPTLHVFAEYYEKQPIELRKPLEEFDTSRLSSFQDGWKYSYRSAPIKDIGTDKYVRIRLILDKRTKGPLDAELFVTYYNNPRDKVPHTPEVCARQAGAIVEKMSTITVDIPELAQEYPEIKVRLIILREPRHRTAEIYVFFVEGQFKYMRDQVRWIIGKPGNRYTYFSKIDAGVFYPIQDDPAEAIEMCKKLLTEALPVLISDHFPLREQLKRH